MGKKFNILTVIVFVLLVINGLVFTRNIFLIYENNKESKETYTKVKTITVNKKEPTENYVSMLKSINKDTVGYLKVNGTNIDYPVVQSTDNSYYLKHDYNNNVSNEGAVFLDYRNDINEFDRNNIIYAHAMLNGTQFGTLRKVVTNEWLSNKDNYKISFMTSTGKHYFEVISVYYIPVTNDYLYTKFNSDEKFLEFEKKLIDRSMYNFNVTPNKNDKLLTLSTCKSGNQRYVLHARLIS